MAEKPKLTINAKNGLTPEQEIKLVQFIKGFDWSDMITMGSVNIKIRDGKPSRITLERTVILD